MLSQSSRPFFTRNTKNSHSPRLLGTSDTSGTEFLIDESYYELDLAALPNGGFAAFIDTAIGKTYDANGAVTGQYSYCEDYYTCSDPAISAFSNGDFIVVYQVRKEYSATEYVEAQVFSSYGEQIGEPLQVSKLTEDTNEYYPKVAVLSNDGFVVTWHSEEREDVYAQLYSPNREKIGDEFRVNTYTSDDQNFPDITALKNGGFVITWDSWYQDIEKWGVYAQRYDANAQKEGVEFRVNTYQTNTQYTSSIASFSDSSFIVAWTSWEQDGDGAGIYAQRYTSSGIKKGLEFQVNTWTDNYQTWPQVAVLSDDSYVIVWESYNQEVATDDANNYFNGYDIYAQRYTSDDVRDGEEFLVNTYTQSDQKDCSIAALKDGGFVIAWTTFALNEGYLERAGTYGQRFDESGNKVSLNYTKASTDDNSASQSATSSGSLIGIIAGVLGAAFALLLASYCFRRYQLKSKPNTSSKDTAVPASVEVIPSPLQNSSSLYGSSGAGKQSADHPEVQNKV
jgi:hypothetical protein